MNTVKCIVCDKEITKQNMPRHRKTRLHQLNKKIKGEINNKK